MQSWSSLFAFSNILICFFTASFNNMSAISIIQNWQSKSSIDRALPLLVSGENTENKRNFELHWSLPTKFMHSAVYDCLSSAFFERSSSSFTISLSPLPYQTLWSASLQKQLQQVVHAVARAFLLFSTIGNPQDPSTGGLSSRKCKTHRKQKP